MKEEDGTAADIGKHMNGIAETDGPLIPSSAFVVVVYLTGFFMKVLLKL